MINYLKVLLLAGLAIVSVSCARQSRVRPDKIAAVYPVFQDTSIHHRNGYILSNGTVVKYDKGNLYVKEYLENNLGNINALAKDPDVRRIADIIEFGETFKALKLPIKVLPFKEFGYIRTSEGNVIFYGLGTESFFDLTNNYISAPISR